MTKTIKHYGIKRRSGRYPWGTGGHSQQRTSDFLGIVAELKSEGLSDKEVAKAMGMSTTALIQNKSLAKAELRSANESQAHRWKEKGMSNVAIGKRMGINESSVRALLDPSISARAAVTKNTSEYLSGVMATEGVIDIGVGVESGLGISRTKLNTAVKALENKGYEVYYIKTPQLGTGKFTSIKVLAPPGTSYGDVYNDRANIAILSGHSDDGGRSFLGLKPIQNVSGERIHIRYDEDGGGDKDGVIELRRGVDDLDLGQAKYAQVRIGVDGTHFMKGMAIYSESIPDGSDIIYNTRKKKSEALRPEDIYKPITADPDNPFGATIKLGGQRGALNVVNEEGDWGQWSKTISSQILSKQSPALAKRQLELSYDIKKAEFDEVMSLTNPVVKAHLLQGFADDADSSSAYLKAVALPRQATHVVLPVPSMSIKEVYAPMYNNGENVVLIRHPHGGVFEIPELTVNNRNPEAKSIMKNAIDAVGIHPKVAQKLSGADFDGDFVVVIPNKRGEIRTAPSLKALKNFDPIEAYPGYKGMPVMEGPNKQLEMGKVSNLITDMTIKGATQNEIAKAVKHSMVVIDAEKHGLNYKQSAFDNTIAELKIKYQGAANAGASTLISKAKSQVRVPFRKEGVLITDPKTGKTKRVYIDKRTGKKLYEETGESYVNKKGITVKRQQVISNMIKAKSAFELSSGTRMETIYATYADRLKGLANKARLAVLDTPRQVYVAKAKKAFQPQVDSLLAKLRLADRNKPLERKAQLVANKIYREKLKGNPSMDAADKKRLRGQVLTEARTRLNAKKPEIEITPKEWTAIQLGAVSHHTVTRIIKSANQEMLKQLAIPRTAYVMTTAKVSKANAMAAVGYTPAEIAFALGVSATTVTNTLGGG